MAARPREEIINLKLADALARRGLGADAETVQARGRPDVLVDLRGLKLVVEGRQAKEEASLREEARRRVAKGIADIGLSVRYDEPLFRTPSPRLDEAIAGAGFSGALFFYSGAGIREIGFSESSIDDLADHVRDVVGLVARDDVVRTQVERVESAIGEAVAVARATSLFLESDTVRRRLMAALAIDE